MIRNESTEKLRSLFLTALMIVSVFAGTIAFSGAAAAAANTPSVNPSPAQSSDSVTVSATAETPGQDLTFAIDGDQDGDITSDEHIATVTSDTETGVAETTFTPSDYISQGDGEYTIYVVEESNDDGNDDTSYPVSDPGSTYDNSATLTVDDTAPDLSSATTADTDNNGQIDQVTVTFSEAVTGVSAGDYSVDSYTITDASDTDGDATVVFTLQEKSSPDTGVTPQVAYTGDASGTTDLAGNPLTEGTTSVAPSDGANPVVTALSVSPSPVTDSDVPGTVEVSLTFSESMDSVSNVQIEGLSQTYDVSGSLDSDTWTGTSAEIADNDEDKTATVTIGSAEDTATNGFAGFTVSNEFTVDTQEPTVDTNFPADGVIGGSVDVTSLFTVSDHGDESTTYEYSTDDGSTWTEITNTGSWDTSSLDDGSVTLRATVTDDVGNSDTASGSITVDNTAPSDVSVDSPTSVVVKKSTGTVDVTYSYTDANPSSATITLVNSSSGDTLTFNVDDSGYAGGNSEKTVNLDLDNADRMTDGDDSNGALVSGQRYTVEVTATDAADNSNSASSPENVVAIDDDQPTAGEITPPAGEVVISDATTETLQVGYAYTDEFPDVAQIKLVDTDDGEGESYTWKIEDDEYVDDGTTKTVTLDLTDFDDSEGADDTKVEDSTYTVKVVATDQVGNQNTITQEAQNVRVDSLGPTFSSASLDTSSKTSSFTIEINDETPDTGTADDTTGVNPDSITVTVTVDGETVVKNAEVGDAGVSFDTGTHTLNVDPMSADFSYTEDSTVTFDVSAEDNAGNYAETTKQYTIRSETPSISDVEANAGDDEITVTFSEPVEAADSALSADDFHYQDVNDGSATAVDAVVDTTLASDSGIEKATLRLNKEVGSNDLGSDLVGARENAIEDYDDDGTYVSTAGVVVDDTTDPSAPDVVAGPINSDNEGSYTITLNHDKEPGTVDVTLTGADGTSVSKEGVVVGADATSTDVTIGDVSGLAEGQVDIDVTRTDAGGNTVTADATVTKDTNAPVITSAEVDAGTSELYVTFNESVVYEGNSLSASDLQIKHDGSTLDIIDHVERVENDDGSYSQTEFKVVLNSPFPADGFDDTPATVETTDVTDLAGNSAGDSRAVSDRTTPALIGLQTAENSKTVTVYFSESVFADTESGDLVAANFTYENTNSGGATGIESVQHTAGDRHAVVTLNASVAPDDLNADKLGIGADEVYDAADNAAPENSYPLSDFKAPDVTLDVEKGANESALVMTVSSDEELSSLTVDVTTEKTTATVPGLTDNSEATLTLADGGLENVTQNVDNGYTYEATYVAPRDGLYRVEATGADAAGNEGESFVHEIGVDTSAPQITDAFVIRSTDDENTDIAVVFDEPVAGGGTFTVNGHYATVDRVIDNVVVVETVAGLQTGDEPKISFKSGGVTEYVGDDQPQGSAVVHTLKLNLKDGHNFVSVPAASGSLEASTLVDEIGAEKVNSIMTYDAATDTWHTYHPDKPADKQPFTEIVGGQGYIINMNDGAVADVNVNNVVGGGSAGEATPGARQLSEGWNLVGHWQEGTQPTPIALSTLDTRSWTTAIYQQQGTGFQYTTGVNLFKPGEAYWVFVQDDDVYGETQFGAEPVPPEPPRRALVE